MIPCHFHEVPLIGTWKCSTVVDYAAPPGLIPISCSVSSNQQTTAHKAASPLCKCSIMLQSPRKLAEGLIHVWIIHAEILRARKDFYVILHLCYYPESQWCNVSHPH